MDLSIQRKSVFKGQHAPKKVIFKMRFQIFGGEECLGTIF